jgi:hypothetical protein
MIGSGRDAAWLASVIPTINMSCEWLGGGEAYSYTHIGRNASMRCVGQSVKQFRMYLRHPGLPNWSESTCPANFTCAIYMSRDTPRGMG